MKLTILGCYGAYPPAGGACSGYLLENDGRRVLIDAGPGVLSRLFGEPWHTVEAVVLSHLHWDHCSDALAMRYALDINKRKMRLVLPEQPAHVSELFGGWGGMEHMIMHDGQQTELAGMTFRFFAMRHPVPSFGMRVECGNRVLAYTGDTNTAASLKPLLHGADIALMDAAFTDEQWSDNAPHLSSSQAARAAAEAGVQRLVLTHLPNAGSEGVLLSQAAAIFEPVSLARELTEYLV